MADVHGTASGLAGKAPKIAIGAAALALLMSTLAVIVVATRGGDPDGPAGSRGAGRAASAAGHAGGASDPAQAGARRVAAADVVRLRREAVVLVRDAGKVLGVRVTDDDLRRALDLGPDDVITALSGRAIERELDVHDAMFALRRLRASTVYVELLRDGQPALVRWQVDGDLQAARAPDPFDLPGGTAGVLGGGLGGSGSLGGSGGLGRGSFGILGGVGVPPPAPDPLADTIKRLDDHSFEVPRATIDRVLASASAYAGIARALPARRTAGLQLFGIRPGSLLTGIGIRNGDTVRALNGNAVGSVDEVAELLPQIKDAREWRIDLDRYGRPVLITIAIK